MNLIAPRRIFENRSARGVLSLLLLAAGFVQLPGDARAQIAAKESVLGRPRLDFESYGLSLDLLSSPDDRSDAARLGGSFDLYPRASVETGHDSNVARTKDDAISSAFTTVTAEAALRSNWTNHEALLMAGVEDTRFAESSREHTTDANLGGTFRFDVDDGIFARGYAEARRDHVARGDDADPGPPYEPLTYNEYILGGVYDDRRDDHVFERLVAEVTHRGYNDTNGVDRSSLDRSTYNLRGLVGITPGGEYDLFLSPSVLREEFSEDVSEDQNSTRFTLSVGTSRDVTGISAFSGRVGVSHRIFDESSRSAQTDFVLSSSLLWNLTPIMTFKAAADIENQQSDDPDAGTKLTRSFGLSLDYDPRDDLILSSFLKAANEDYQQIDREDDDLRFGVGATYLINDYLFAGLRFEHDIADSTDPTHEYAATVVSFRLGAKLCCMSDDGVVNPFNLGRFY